MFHIVRKMEKHTTNDIFQELNQTYKIALDLLHKVQDVLDEDPAFDLSGVCEADEVYIVAGEKSTKQASPKRGTFDTDKPPVVTFVQYFYGRVLFLVQENLRDVVKNTVEYGDEEDPAVLCMDQYAIEKNDKCDEIDGYSVINYHDHFVIGDAHANSCKTATASFAPVCGSSEVSQNTTYRAI